MQRRTMTLTIEVPDDDLLSLNEVCKFIRKDRAKVHGWIKSGRFPRPIREGKSDVWTARSIGVWMASVEFHVISLAGDDDAEEVENDGTDDTPVKRKTPPENRV